MALCESQLDSAVRQEPEPVQPNGTYGLDQVPGGVPLTVDYRSPVSHFVPPHVELFAARKSEPITTSTPESSTSGTPTPMKRKRGRPRVDKTSPEYLANLAARKQAKEMAAMMNRNSTDTPSGEKRKRGRPRVDKTSPEYLARKRARELEALERKAKREYRRAAGARSVVKTSSKLASKLPTKATKLPTKGTKLPTKGTKLPTKGTKLPNALAKSGHVANKLVRSGNVGNRLAKPGNANKLPKTANRRKAPSNRIRNMQGVKAVKKIADRKALIRRRLIKKRDSAASSSAGESTPRVKRKYTKRAPGTKKSDTPGTEKVKGKRGRPRKTDLAAKQMQQPKIRVRSNLMPTNNETITLDSDDEPDLGSPSQASDSLSLDENLRALRHIHEKYANIDKDDLYEAHLLAANFKKPVQDQRRDDDEVLSIRSSEGTASVKEVDRVEKLEDSSNSDSDSSSSGSGSGSSSSSSSSSSENSSSSDSSDSDSESDTEKPAATNDSTNGPSQESNDRSYGAWSYNSTENDHSGSDWDSDPERAGAPPPAPPDHDDISESDNESADKSFQCHICRKWYSTRVTLKIHRRSHQKGGGGGGRSRARSSDRYECDCCSDTFTRREKLWEHKASAHRGSMTVRCEVCRKCFEDDSELNAHLLTHTADERAGRCSECGAMFPRYDQLRRHRAVAHAAASGSRLAHACAQCGKRFGHAHSLTRHMQNHAKQLYRCVVCKASFARADQLAQHLNSHLANYKRLKP